MCGGTAPTPKQQLQSIVKVPGPEGIVYAIGVDSFHQLYIHEETPISLTIARLNDPLEDEDYDPIAGDIPEVHFDGDMDGPYQVFDILDPTDLSIQLKEELEEAFENDPQCDLESLSQELVRRVAKHIEYMVVESPRTAGRVKKAAATV